MQQCWHWCVCPALADAVACGVVLPTVTKWCASCHRQCVFLLKYLLWHPFERLCAAASASKHAYMHGQCEATVTCKSTYKPSCPQTVNISTHTSTQLKHDKHKLSRCMRRNTLTTDVPFCAHRVFIECNPVGHTPRPLPVAGRVSTTYNS